MASAQANIHTYLAPLTGPGRTAPNLLEDITLYDPHFQSQPGRNLLADGPLNFGGSQYLYHYLPEAGCRHEFLLQPRQTKVPELDERPSPSTVYQVAAVCQRCRIHLCLKVDYGANTTSRPCPNAEHPLHHLIRSTFNNNIALGEAVQNEENISSEIYAYQCSSSSCSAVVTVRLTPEILTDEAVHILTDTTLLKQRTDDAFAAKAGDTEGMRRPSATDVLTDLRTYIRNSWKTDSRSEISLDNKRFAVRFGPGGVPCAEVLESLDFALKPGVSWLVPKPKPESSKLLEDPFNVFLDNAEYELSTLILARPEPERQFSQDTTSLPSANHELARVLGCQNYEKAPGSGASNNDPASRPAAYTILGVPVDLDDEVILFAYEWQCGHHIQGSPHYLSALKRIAAQRSSDALYTKCAIEESNGRITYEQLIEAYRKLGLSMHVAPDEDHIIGTFESRVQDARSQELSLRESLRVIGVGLNSNKIIDHAAKQMSTYDQALTYLGVKHDTSDEFVQSMYTLKVTEHPSHQEMAEKAVRLIAMHRQSAPLGEWISSGFSNQVQHEMDIGDAYNALEISDRTMDDETLLAVYNVRKTENTDQDRITRAFRAIAQNRDSPTLLNFLTTSVPGNSQLSLSEPVGLDNIGNTCYLNSLLQFLFTIKVVRDIVLDFDQYRMEPTPEKMAAKKVGQRKISKREVETAQKFVTSLAALFQSMITAPRTAIKPEQELARLTLETDQVKEKIRRRSTLPEGTRPSLGVIENREIQGPLPSSSDQLNGITEETPLLSPEAMSILAGETNPTDELYTQSPTTDVQMTTEGDNSSEVTLVSRQGSGLHTPPELVSTEQQQAIFDNKENLAPLKIEPSQKLPPSGEPLRPASPSKINAQAGTLASQSHAQDTDALQGNFQDMPPPVPPRKPVQPRAVEETKTLEEYARQQDVTEVVGHCLFQLSCAMRPTGFDKSGEQRDEIHDLFFGEARNHTVPDKSTLDTPLPFLNVQAAVINQPRDVYAALDNYFDLSDAGNGRQGFISVTKLPPVLTITLGRVVWDSKSNSQKKLDHHVEMPQTIYMDRYLETDPTSMLMQQRKQSWELKQKLIKLSERKADLEQKHAESADVPSLFDDARRSLEYLETEVFTDSKFGGPVPFDPELKEVLGKLAETKRSELEATKQLLISETGRLNDLFADMRTHPYVIHAAFFHRGSHGSGHYWVYIVDHKTGTWRKYNDDHVTIVKNLGEIFDKPDGTGGWSGTANPYFIVYIKRGDAPPTLDELVETIKREPIPASDTDSGISIEPLGTGRAVAQGLMSLSGGRATSQMSEMPPDSMPPRWDPAENVSNNVSTTTTGTGGWAGEGVTAAGISEGDGVVREGHVGDWQYYDSNPDHKW